MGVKTLVYRTQTYAYRVKYISEIMGLGGVYWI